ncbi:hypothetical protein Tiera_035 [Polaromonas phage Tiera]|nr:hypothetical protein Tiera_035 [Polaromonas phage Tiera]
MDLLLTCERKFQLEKLLVTDVEREETEHTVFGKAFGTGIQTYLVTQDADRALYEAWLAYFPVIETDKKNQIGMMRALLAAFPKLDTLLEEYEIVYFNNKPAIELSFRINISEHFYFVGYFDAVLRHKVTKVCFVFEAKSTGLLLLDLDPVYKNSGQGLVYSIALDSIVGKEQSSYGVMYFIAQMKKDGEVAIHVKPYNKTLLDRLNWFITLAQDVQRLDVMREMNVYPMRGKSCLNFNRPCKHFGTCGFKSQDVLKEREEDVIEYDFVYELEDLVKDHVSRVKSKSGQINPTIKEI